MKILKNLSLLFVLMFISSSGFAESNIDDYRYDQYIDKLDKLNYLPVLLPLILNNKDAIELTDAQVGALKHWREINREKVLANMNHIVEMRAKIMQVALSKDVTSDDIAQIQDEIFEAQRHVLAYKLSCRDLVFDTFKEKNWEGLMFVLAENSDMNLALSQ